MAKTILRADKLDGDDIKFIHQFLVHHKFESTADTLMLEASKKCFENGSNDAFMNEKEFSNFYKHIIRSFENGDWRNFFTLWKSFMPEKIQESKEYKILTLNLHVHFAILPKRKLLSHGFKEKDERMKNVSEAEYRDAENFLTEIEKSMNEAMEELRNYLDTVGRELECEPTLRPFFALPFIEEPHTEPCLSKIFEEKWLGELIHSLQSFMDKHKESFVSSSGNDSYRTNKNLKKVPSNEIYHTNSTNKHLPNDNVPIIPNDRNIPLFVEGSDISEQYSMRENMTHSLKSRSTQTHKNGTNSSLDDIDSSDQEKNEKALMQYSEELAMTKSHLCTTHSNYERLKLRFHKLHADYHKLISVAGELTAALENSVKGHTIDLQSMLETCINIFPDLFNQNIRENSQSLIGLQLSKSSSDIHGSHNQQLDSDITPVSPKLLDFRKIKMHLINGNIKVKLFLLQALRRKITLSEPAERDEAIHEYISKDLLGLHGQIASDNGKSILPYLLTPGNIIMPHPLQQSAARLLNTLSSFRCGRDYLSSGTIVVNVILKCLSNTTNNEIDAFTCNMLIATLQKLSLRKQQRIYMVENGLVEWLIHHLHNECHVMGPYRLEYATALLMNLSLHKIAQKRASGMASLLISTLLTLLSIDHAFALPYINGALNNFLTNRIINDEAKRMKLSPILEHYRNHKTGEIRRHIDHILKIHRGESTVNIEDDETADDDNEEFDIIENELENNDPVKHYPEELSGEALLATCYTISKNTAHERSARTEFSTFKCPKINSTITHDSNCDGNIDNQKFVPDCEELLPRESGKTNLSSSVDLADGGKLSSIASLNINSDEVIYANSSFLKLNQEISTEEAFVAKPKLSRTPP